MGLRILGTVLNSYLIFETKEGIYWEINEFNSFLALVSELKLPSSCRGEVESSSGLGAMTVS